MQQQTKSPLPEGIPTVPQKFSNDLPDFDLFFFVLYSYFSSSYFTCLLPNFNLIQNASTLHVFCKHGLHFQTHPFFYSKKHPVPTAITYTVFCGNAFFCLQSIHAGSDSFFYIGPVIYMENFKGTGI